MKILNSFLFILIFSLNAIFAQHQNVIIGNSVSWGLPTEPSVIINPLNPDEMMVGAMSNNYYTSIDGGFSWSQGYLQSSWGVQADPCVLVDNSGRYYYLHLPNVIERVICHRRESLTSPWSLESSAAYNETHEVDKEWATYDPVNDKIYLSWTYFDEWGSSNPNDSSCIYLSWSENGGESWNEPVRISDQKGNAQGGPYSMHGSYPTTGPNGEVYICWWGPDGLMFDRSLDQGTSWLPDDINITNEHINWIYSIPGIELGVSFPVITCDRSDGENNGNIYICWADKGNGGNDSDVFIVKSEDDGLNWSDPIRINDDPPGSHQFFPFITVDQVSGKVWIVFYDRRNYSDTNTDVYMAVSEDGGETFTNFKISETPFIPYNTVFFGHYIALSAHDDHVFPVWNRMDEGISTLMGAIVNPDLVGEEEYKHIVVAELTNSPNPFNENSFITFKIRKAGIVSLQLFDISGRLIQTIINKEEYTPGKYVKKINATELKLKPGSYYIELISGNDQVTTKTVFVE